jgi:hypothetical protein
VNIYTGDVCSLHKADIVIALSNVRFWEKSGHQ